MKQGENGNLGRTATVVFLKELRGALYKYLCFMVWTVWVLSQFGPDLVGGGAKFQNAPLHEEYS